MSPGPREPVVGVLLAGGRARRMGGGDKCLLPLAGRPLLAHVIDRLRPQVSDLILNANGNPDRFASFGLAVVADPIEGFAGPLAGVLAGMRWAQARQPETRWIVTAATDTPFFPDHLVRQLVDATGGVYPSMALASSQGRTHPVFGLWPTALADDLAEALETGVRKVLDWTDRHAMVQASFAPVRLGGRMLDPFYNVNRPNDLTEADSLLASVRS